MLNRRTIAVPVRKVKSSIKCEEDNLKKDKFSDDLEVYNPSLMIKNSMNNKLLSDVTFIIGQSKETFYGHKTFISLASPVFERMFYGDFMQSEDQIVEIIDVTGAGFLNVLKYIYGYGIEIEPNHIYETYRCGDKYLVTGFKNSLLSYIQKILNKSNLMIIYEQLLKLEEEKEIFDLVKASISINCSFVFNSESFLQIDQITLINLLNLNYLNMNEIDILNCCLNWCQYQYNAYKYSDSKKDLNGFFDLIKNHIKFNHIKIDDIKRSKLFKFLNLNELGLLLINLIFEQKHETIECLTKRLTVNPFRLLNTSSRSYFNIGRLIAFDILLKSNRKIFISSILTSIEIIGGELACKDIDVTFFEIDDNQTKLNELKVKDKQKIIEDQKYFKICFSPYLEIDNEKCYSLNFQSPNLISTGILTYLDGNLELKKDDYRVKINLTSQNDQKSCIKGINFYPDF